MNDPRLGDTMIIDRAMPVFDAARIEHRVIEGSPERVYAVALDVDLRDVLRMSAAARALFWLRERIEQAVSALPGRPAAPPPAPDGALRLGELPEHGDWVALGREPGREFAFGVAGRFWSGETAWEQIDAADFAGFDRPGAARIAANLSFRPYGPGRTLVTYECRVQATDDAARRAFMRYWRPASPLIGVVLRSALALIANTARERET